MTRLTVIDGGGEPGEQRPRYGDAPPRRPMTALQRHEQLELALRHLCANTAWCDVNDVENIRALRRAAENFHHFLGTLEADLLLEVE